MKIVSRAITSSTRSADDRADHRPLARVAAGREQHHAQRLASPRGKHVVAHVADGRERVAVGALRVHAGVLAGSGASARRARASRRRRGRRPAAIHAIASPPVGMCGDSWLARPPDDGRERDERHQGLDEGETAVHGGDDVRSGRARPDRSSCNYPQNGVLIRRYPPPLGQASPTQPIGCRGLLPTCRARAGRRSGAPGRHPDATAAPPSCASSEPGGKPLIREGQVNRELLGGTWYFRQDDTFVGEDERWFDAGRPGRLDRDHRPPQLERHGHDREPPVGGLVPQGVHASRARRRRRKPLLEGPLRGQQLPDRGLAERQAARASTPATSRSRCC